MFCDVNFMYRLYHDCARTLKRSFAAKLAIVQLSSGFSFARNFSRAPCALASFSRARIPRSACTHDVTCELYCSMKLMSELESLRAVYPNSCLCALHYVARFNLLAVLSNFKFRGITKMPGILGGTWELNFQ